MRAEIFNDRMYFLFKFWRRFSPRGRHSAIRILHGILNPDDCFNVNYKTFLGVFTKCYGEYAVENPKDCQGHHRSKFSVGRVSRVVRTFRDRNPELFRKEVVTTSGIERRLEGITLTGGRQGAEWAIHGLLIFFKGLSPLSRVEILGEIYVLLVERYGRYIAVDQLMYVVSEELIRLEKENRSLRFSKEDHSIKLPSYKNLSKCVGDFWVEGRKLAVENGQWSEELNFL